jgi:hypothetical protein
MDDECHGGLGHAAAWTVSCAVLFLKSSGAPATGSGTGRCHRRNVEAGLVCGVSQTPFSRSRGRADLAAAGNWSLRRVWRIPDGGPPLILRRFPGWQQFFLRQFSRRPCPIMLVHVAWTGRVSHGTTIHSTGRENASPDPGARYRFSRFDSQEIWGRIVYDQSVILIGILQSCPKARPEGWRKFGSLNRGAVWSVER